ncbi:ABC transporter substrate-binding protein [Streptococcus oralis]|uniref:Ferric iron ABC transporter, iron-binding protein n=1 Tax=Streptococcus oralis TaxID=1303 RepID=A0A139NXK7_STROR|nr:extracellular solute-binding protein [Streptococcus oralis]KXT80651.1 Ferric iron ABC transporter, iron-binding protein [Streptococcus oralis]
MKFSKTAKMIATSVVTLASVVALAACTSSSQKANSSQTVEVETKSLNTLYQEALKEGGTVVYYAGGDTAEQNDDTKTAFEQRFPGMKLEVVTDYSKVQNGRLEYQMATNNVVADVVQLQTLNDFTYWKKQNKLLTYKPAGWDKVYKDFKDPDGTWVGGYVLAFGNVVNTKALGSTSEPKTAKDLLNSELKGKLISTYPNDDDAVLFWYKQMIDKNGWEWMANLIKQDPKFVRGTQEPGDKVGAGEYAVTLGTAGLLDQSAESHLVIPEKEGFVAWAQRMAILKDAKHPAGAKLFENWLLDKETQQNNIFQWSVRTDATPAGVKPIWEYKNANLKEFVNFMEDRAEVERFRAQIRLFVGDVQGPSSAGERGLTPSTRAVQ